MSRKRAADVPEIAGDAVDDCTNSTWRDVMEEIKRRTFDLATEDGRTLDEKIAAGNLRWERLKSKR